MTSCTRSTSAGQDGKVVLLKLSRFSANISHWCDTDGGRVNCSVLPDRRKPCSPVLERPANMKRKCFELKQRRNVITLWCGARLDVITLYTAAPDESSSSMSSFPPGSTCSLLDTDTLSACWELNTCSETTHTHNKGLTDFDRAHVNSNERVFLWAHCCVVMYICSTTSKLLSSVSGYQVWRIHTIL